MSLISVIVPIFGAEKTLLRCLDSLKSQTFEDFEVLMIDDGSPDRCGEIIDDYAKSDNRFKAFHKENGGVSSARQFGIDHAQGVYTIHADPDDWVEPKMLEALYGKAIEADADMVICDFYENTYKGQKYIKQEPSSLNHKDVLHDIFSNIHGSTCNKLIKRCLYTDFKIKFPLELSFCEDQYVIASLLTHNIKIEYLPRAFYHYIRDFNYSTLSRNYNEQTFQKDICRREKFDELLRNSSIRLNVYNRNTYSIISRAFYFGNRYYSSRQFKKIFKSEICIVKQSDAPTTEKCLIYLSCLGYYRPAFLLLSLVLFFKHHF